MVSHNIVVLVIIEFHLIECIIILSYDRRKEHLCPFNLTEFGLSSNIAFVTGNESLKYRVDC